MNTTPWISKDGVSDADLVRAGRDLLAALELAEARILFIEKNYQIGVDRSCNSRVREAIAKVRGARS